MNSTDAGPKMCAGDFKSKMPKTSKNYSRHKRSTKHKRAQGSEEAHLATADEKETQPMSNDMSVIRGNLFSTNQTQVRGSMDPNAAAKPTYQKQYHVLKTKDSTCQPLDESWRRLAAGPGRPTAQWAPPPWRLLIGGERRFGED